MVTKFCTIDIPYSAIETISRLLKDAKLKPKIGKPPRTPANTNDVVEISLTLKIEGPEHENTAKEIIKDHKGQLRIGTSKLPSTKIERFIAYLEDVWKGSVAIYLGTLASVAATIDIVSKHLPSNTSISLDIGNVLEIGLVSGVPAVIDLLYRHKRKKFKSKRSNNNGTSTNGTQSF